jgi:hypothetical protein
MDRFCEETTFCDRLLKKRKMTDRSDRKTRKQT